MRPLFAAPVADANRMLLLDCSFCVINRFLAIVAWNRKAGVVKPDAPGMRAPGDACPPCSEAELTAFGDSFKTMLMNLVRKYGVLTQNVIFLLDCSRADIWRKDILPAYKESRTSPNNFPPNVFHHFYNVTLPELKQSLGVRSICSPRAEADDIAYVASRHYSGLGKDVTLVTADMDYAQLAGPRVQVHDLKGNCVLEKACAKAGTAVDAAAYLHCKCIVGDVSDNIRSIRARLGPKTALKLSLDPAALARELENPETRRHHDQNVLLIDMSRMPEQVKQEIADAIAAIE